MLQPGFVVGGAFIKGDITFITRLSVLGGGGGWGGGGFVLHLFGYSVNSEKDGGGAGAPASVFPFSISAYGPTELAS
jgi:hypothetical protein